MIKKLLKPFKCPFFANLTMAFIAAFALIMALIAQYGFNLDPCILCIIQRYPFGIIIALGLIGAFVSRRDVKWGALTLRLIGLDISTQVGSVHLPSQDESHFR